MNRPILITGAGGVVGSFLAPYLAARGIPVIAVLRHAAGQPDIPGIRWLISPIEKLTESLTGVEMIVHAAATSPGPGVDADQIIQDNIEATRHLIALARKAGVERFLFLSAVSAYGTVSVPVLDEATPSVNPDIYGLSKRVCEDLLKDAGLPSLCLRLPAVVGPGAKRNWMTRVKANIMAGRAVEVFNPSAPYNNLVHLSDLGDLVIKLRDRPFVEHDRVVLGAAGQIEMIAAIRTLMEGMGREAVVEKVSTRQSSFIIDSRLARERYGYHPMDITEMIRRFAVEPL